jgi:hypothetical protein
MKKVSDFTRFLLDNGILFEINRKVLHPLGLVMVTDVDYEDDKKVIITGLYSADDDLEGIVFDPETFEEGRKRYQEFLGQDGQTRLDVREKRLGFVIQESSGDENNGRPLHEENGSSEGGGGEVERD